MARVHPGRLRARKRNGLEEPTTAERADGESRRAEQVLDRAGFPAARGGEMVLVQSSDATVRDPEIKSAIADVVEAVSSQPIVAEVTSPLDGGSVSEDGRSGLVEFEIKGDAGTVVDRIAPVTAAVDRVAERHPDVTIGQFGANLRQSSPSTSPRSRAGDVALDVLHADHPGPHVRRARRGRGPRAAGHDRGHGDDRPHRDRQPGAPAGSRLAAGDHPDRPRRGRRLLAVLRSPGARGASRRP